MTKSRYVNPNALREGVVQAHTLYGAPAHNVPNYLIGASEGKIQQVRQAHARNYEPPKRRDRDNPEKVLCSYEDCKAYPSKKFNPYCAGHARKLKLPGADWSGGRKPKKDSDGDTGRTDSTGSAADGHDGS